MQRPRYQYHSESAGDESYSSVQNSYVPLSNNGLPPTNSNGLIYSPQNANWSQAQLTNEHAEDLFGHFLQTQSCNNTDYNFNVALNLALDFLPNNITSNELQQLHCGILSNPHGNLILNIHDSHNMTATGQSYCPSSTVTDVSGDSGFLSSSPMQHFSPEDSSMQNCFSNLQCSKFEEVCTC